MRSYMHIPVVVACCTLLAACDSQSDSKSAAPQPAPPVGYMTVQPRDALITVQLPGRTTPYLASDVRPQVAGILKGRDFREGADVKAGDLLYEIDPSTYQAAVEGSEAALLKAQASLVSTKATASRKRQLAKETYASQQDVDTAVAAEQQSEADIKAAQANLDTAKIALDRTRVTAPISGRIGKSTLTPGALVTASQTTALTTIQQIDPIYVDLDQSTSDLLRLRQEVRSGKLKQSSSHIPVHVVFEGGQVFDQVGQVEFTDITVNQTTGTVSLRAQFPNPSSALLPGMFVRAILDIGSDPNAILIPQRAVTRNTLGQATVMVLAEESKVQQRVITPSQTIGNAWLLEDGLKIGDRVIVEGLQSASVGTVVKGVEVTIDDETGLVVDEAKTAAAASAPGERVAEAK